MKEEHLFEQMKLWRKWTVEFLRTIPEEFVDQIPPGHNNSIRWNAGHILVGWDNTFFQPLMRRDKCLYLITSFFRVVLNPNIG